MLSRRIMKMWYVVNKMSETGLEEVCRTKSSKWAAEVCKQLNLNEDKYPHGIGPFIITIEG